MDLIDWIIVGLLILGAIICFAAGITGLAIVFLAFAVGWLLAMYFLNVFSKKKPEEVEEPEKPDEIDESEEEI